MSGAGNRTIRRGELPKDEADRMIAIGAARALIDDAIDHAMAGRAVAAISSLAVALRNVCDVLESESKGDGSC